MSRAGLGGLLAWAWVALAMALYLRQFAEIAPLVARVLWR